MGAARPIQPEESIDLLNQWAVDASGRVLHAHECSASVSYWCPREGCGERLMVRAVGSRYMRAHLFHVDACRAGESSHHALAKRIVSSRLSAWTAGKAALPLVLVSCPTHPKWSTPWGYFGGATEIIVEAVVGARRADVLVRRGDGPPTAIEVLHAHEVDDAKADDLAAGAVPWVELAAVDVIRAQDFRWTALRSAPGPDECAFCVRVAAERACSAVLVARNEVEARLRAETQRLAQVESDIAAQEARRAEARRQAEFQAQEAWSAADRAKDEAARARKQAEAEAAVWRRPLQPGEQRPGDMPSPALVLDFTQWRDRAIARERRIGEDPAWAALRLHHQQQRYRERNG